MFQSKNICFNLHTHTRAHTHTHTKHARTYTYTHIHEHTYTYTHIHRYTHVYSTHIDICTIYIHTFTHIYIHTQRCRLGELAAASFGLMLRFNSTLTDLDLSGNSVGDSGAKMRKSPPYLTTNTQRFTMPQICFFLQIHTYMYT